MASRAGGGVLRLGARLRPSFGRLAAPIAKPFAEHNLLTYAAAIAFQGLIALVPMTLLRLGLLGATGHREAWTRHVAPAVHHRVLPGVYRGIDETVRPILNHASTGLIALPLLLSVSY